MKHSTLGMLAIFLMCASGSAADLLDPPVFNTWAYAQLDVAPMAEDEADSCSFETIDILATHSSQILPDALPVKEREAYERVSDRIKQRYEQSESRERARLSLDLLNLRGDAAREIRQAWIRVDEMPVHFVWVYDVDSGNTIIKVEDEISGVYIGRCDETANMDEIKVLVEEALASGADQAKIQELSKKIGRAAEGSTSEIIVNGLAFPVDESGAPLSESEEFTIEKMWAHFFDEHYKERLQVAILVLWMAMEDEYVFSILPEKWIMDPEDTPIDQSLLTCARAFKNGENETDMIGFAAPPDDILEDFFGKRVLPLPNSDWSFKRLKANLL